MPTAKELKDKFWSALKSDMTVMIGLDGSGASHLKPMTAQLDGGKGSLWFFTAKDTDLAKKLRRESRAVATFVSKGHDLFATIHGELSADNDPEMVDRLWNRFVAAWYEGGKDDPNLLLLRFDPSEAEIWLDASGLLAGVKLLIGIDPKSDYKDSAKKVKLG